MIDSQTLPSWDSVFSRVGEPPPRRGRARCPIHGGDSPTSVSVNEEKGVYFCHVCHSSGDKLDFVQRATGTGFKQALALLGVDPGMRLPKPDPAIVHKREAIKVIRKWCRQTGRRLRDEYFTRQQIMRHARKRLSADPEDPLGWELLRVASDGEARNEFLLDEIGLCRTDEERIHAWRTYRDAF